MGRPPPLTPEQRDRLSELEPALREAAELADYSRAKRITKQIQDVLRPTGHETRLMLAKNWLYETALASGEIDFAIVGLEAVRKKTRIGTRVHLEATALLAIGYLRSRRFSDAKPLMKHVLTNDECIRSQSRRRQFRRRMIARFDEEGAIAALKGQGHDVVTAEDVERDAGEIVRTNSEDAIFDLLGKAMPSEVVRQIRRRHI